jgi:hypothetical protein
MAGVHMFHAVQHPELDTLGLVAIHDLLPAARGAEQQDGRRQRHADHSGSFH